MLFLGGRIILVRIILNETFFLKALKLKNSMNSTKFRLKNFLIKFDYFIQILWVYAIKPILEFLLIFNKTF